ncbi:MAG: hypothetical protein ACI4I8_02175 [Oscillospiraceae bacterium]
MSTNKKATTKVVAFLLSSAQLSGLQHQFDMERQKKNRAAIPRFAPKRRATWRGCRKSKTAVFKKRHTLPSPVSLSPGSTGQASAQKFCHRGYVHATAGYNAQVPSLKIIFLFTKIKHKNPCKMRRIWYYKFVKSFSKLHLGGFAHEQYENPG